MSITYKDAEGIQGMRTAGRLAGHYASPSPGTGDDHDRRESGRTTPGA